MFAAAVNWIFEPFGCGAGLFALMLTLTASVMTNGIVLPAPALSGASAVLVALRTQTPTDEVALAADGVHVNVLLELHV